MREHSTGTVTGNSHGERAGVSPRPRDRSSAGYGPGVRDHLQWGAPKAPEGLAHARRTKPNRTAETAAAFQLELSLMNDSCGTERPRAAEKAAVKASYGRLLLPVIDDRVGDDVIRSEPPGTDPYAGWCGGPGANYSRLPD